MLRCSFNREICSLFNFGMDIIIDYCLLTTSILKLVAYYLSH